MQTHICPKKNMSFVVGGDFEAGRQGVIKYEVRSTKYEVKELGATELRGHGGRMQSQNDVWGPDTCPREVGTHVAGGYMKRYSRGTTVHHK